MKKVIDDNKIIPVLAPKFSREFSAFIEKCYVERTKALKDVSEIPDVLRGNRDIEQKENETNTMKELLKLIQEWIDKKKVGSLQINFFKGGVSSVKLEETIKLPKQD